MPKNTGRGSRYAGGSTPVVGPWSDESTREWEVWTESDGVVIYDGPKESASKRRLLTPSEARELARLLLNAAATAPSDEPAA